MGKNASLIKVQSYGTASNLSQSKHPPCIFLSETFDDSKVFFLFNIVV